MASILQAAWTWDWSLAWYRVLEIWEPVLFPMFVAGMILGPLVAMPFYFMTRQATAAFRERRRSRLMAKAQLLRDRARSTKRDSRVGSTA